MQRKEFLKTALSGTAALFAVNWGTLAQIRAYKHPDKPLLTEANLNRLFNKFRTDRNSSGISEALENTPAFLRKYFSVSPEQEKTIERMKPEQWEEIQSVIRDAKEGKGSLQFTFIPDRIVNKCATQIRLMSVKKEVQPGNKQPVTVNEELRKIIV